VAVRELRAWQEGKERSEATVAGGRRPAAGAARRGTGGRARSARTLPSATVSSKFLAVRMCALAAAALEWPRRARIASSSAAGGAEGILGAVCGR